MPLILPSQRVIRPNPLAYPAGATPRFNRAPFTPDGKAISVVAAPGNFVSLETSARGTILGAPVGRIDSLIGPCISSSVNDEITFPFTVASPSSLVIAGIFRIPAAAGGTGFAQYIVGNFSSVNGAQIFFSNAGDLSYFDFSATITTMIPSGTAGLLGGAFFAIVSIVNSGTINWSVTNLSSGKIYTGSNAAVSASGTESVFSLGNRLDQQRPFTGGLIAAGALLENTTLSPAQLAQYATDPWSLWYPRRTIQYTTPAATTTTSGGARIRQRWNRSPLAYPAGAVPGIDWSHPAAQSLRAMVFPQKGNALNLAGTSGFQKGTNGGAGLPASTIDSNFGPACVSSGSFETVVLTGPTLPTTPVGTGYTFASIVKPKNVAATTVFITSGDVSGSDLAVYQGIIGGNLALRIPGTVTFDSGIAATNNVPYFFASVVVYMGGTTWNHWHVVRRLDTGQTFPVASNTATAGAATFTSGTFFYNGAINFGAAVVMGPAMVSTATLSPSQLLAFASDPWSFWYPNKTINLASSTASAGASFLPVWAYRYNLPVLGTGNF